MLQMDSKNDHLQKNLSFAFTQGHDKRIYELLQIKGAPIKFSFSMTILFLHMSYIRFRFIDSVVRTGIYV